MRDKQQYNKWIKRAKNDMFVAKRLFYDFYPKQLEICCYQCHQSTEKALKAFLIINNKPFPFTHDLVQLCYLCADIDSKFSDLIDDCADLTPYATQARYPSNIEIEELETELALRKAECILNFCNTNDDELEQNVMISDTKPTFLYHGSQYFFDSLMPKQAADNTDSGSQFAIYACEQFEDVIPFALPIRWYPDNPNGKRDYRCKNGMTVIEYGSINPSGFGYVYKVSSEYFDKIDDWQWIATKEVKPIDIIQIKVEDYWHTISFSKEALEINKSLYPFDELY